MYANIVNYLVSSKTPPHFSPKEKHQLVEWSLPYSRLFGYLFWIGPNNVMRICVREDETHDIIHACHDEPHGGHFTTNKLLLTNFSLRFSQVYRVLWQMSKDGKLTHGDEMLSGLN